jgi:phage terminase large subunit-like protein
VVGELAETPARPRGVGPKAVYDAASGRWREGAYWFDERAADAAVRFYEQHIKLTKGEWAGRAFHVQDWQQDDILRPLFGWKRADGTRRYRRCFVWVPRKNGKTELAAGIALLMLVGDAEHGGEVYSIAYNRDQASIVFDRIVDMVSRSDALSRDLECYKESIFCPALRARFQPLSGKASGKHGLFPSGLIGDEIHEWPNGDLYQFVHDGMTARRQPLEFLISTAGKKGGYGEEVWSECVKIRDGVIDDPETLVVIYAADPEDDWEDPETWKKANPNYGVSVKEDAFRAEALRAKQMPRLVNDFLRYRLNRWTENETLWLPLDAVDDNGRAYGWRHCTGPHDWRALEEICAGKTCFGGVDLSKTTDLSAYVLWFPAQDGLEKPVALARFFKPAELLAAHEKTDKLPYRRWVEEGAITATPGNVVDYSYIREAIARDAAKFRFAFAGQGKRKESEGSIGFDPFNAMETMLRLGEEGLPVVQVRQGFLSLNEPSKEVERLVVENGFWHGGHPVLDRHAAVAAIETDAAGNIKPAKNKSSERIDGIAALVTAMALWVRNREPAAKQSFWEKRP